MSNTVPKTAPNSNAENVKQSPEFSTPETGFSSFSDFYPYYLSEHSNFQCRVLHFIGTFIVIDLLLLSVVIQQWWPVWLAPLVGYGFAWVGHFFFEQNKPATFKHPFYSLIGDYRLFFEMVGGKHWQR